MNSNRKAQAATFLLLGALGCVILWERGSFRRVTASAPKTSAAQPEDAIYASLDAIREGNLAKFAGAHAGSMEASLRSTAREVGEARLVESLQARNALVKGVAIQELERLSEREVKARVEYVFAGRNEVQITYLEKIGERWKIVRVDGAERVDTLIPYGTPVN